MNRTDWKSIGTSIFTLGISYLVKRYAKKRAPLSLQEMMDAALMTGVVQPALAEAAEVLRRAQFDARLAELLAASRSLLKSAPGSFARAGVDLPPIPPPRGRK